MYTLSIAKMLFCKQKSNLVSHNQSVNSPTVQNVIDFETAFL